MVILEMILRNAARQPSTHTLLRRSVTPDRRMGRCTVRPRRMHGGTPISRLWVSVIALWKSGRILCGPCAGRWICGVTLSRSRS